MEAGKSPIEANLIEATSGRKSIHLCVWNMTEKKELKRKEMRTKWEIKPSDIHFCFIPNHAQCLGRRRVQVIINFNHYRLDGYNTLQTYIYNSAYIVK